MATTAQSKRKKPINWSRESCLGGRAIPGCLPLGLRARWWSVRMAAILRDLEIVWGESVGEVRDDDRNWPWLVK